MHDARNTNGHSMTLLFVDVLGYAAAAAVFATYSMKTMIPLRLVGIVSNCLFIGYGVMAGALPVLVLHIVLLPLNVWRLHEMASLIAKVKKAASGDLSIEWLKPFMHARQAKENEVIFRAGDEADRMFYVVSGQFVLVEPDLAIAAGALVGEMGLVSPNNRRAFTFRCEEGGELLVMGFERVRELYFQNPQFGFYLMRLIAERMIRNMMTSTGDTGAAMRSSFGDLDSETGDSRFGQPRQARRVGASEAENVGR
jgi:CRP/FNR family transcriptional regulator, cyclic AMP receptor protein